MFLQMMQAKRRSAHEEFVLRRIFHEPLSHELQSTVASAPPDYEDEALLDMLKELALIGIDPGEVPCLSFEENLPPEARTPIEERVNGHVIGQYRHPYRGRPYGLRKGEA